MEYLTTREAAQMLGVHKNSAKRSMIARGLEPVQIGKNLAWRREDVARLAEDAPLTNVPTPEKVNREFTKAATFNVALNPPSPDEVARRLAAAKRRRTGVDGVRVRAYQKMVSDAVRDEFRPVSPCVVVKMAVRAEVRYRGLT